MNKPDQAWDPAKESRPALKPVVGAICAMAAYHFAATGARYLPDGAIGAAIGALIRLCAAALVVLAYVIWHRRAEKDSLPSPAELKNGDSSAITAIAALCGACLQLAAIAAVALATHSEGFGVREAPYDAASAIRLFSAVAVAPVCEELVYRGIAFRLMDRVSPTVVAALVTSLVFALTHGDAITAAVACYVSFFLAILVSRRRSLVPAIALHAAFNLTSFFTGYIPLSPAAALAIFAPLSAVGIIALVKGKKK